jgi:hypothetical protein
MCPEHAIAFMVDQMKMSYQQATEFVKNKISKNPDYFAKNTSGAKSTDKLSYPKKPNC